MKPPICPTHKTPKAQKFNSALFVCIECEKERQKQQSLDRISKNKALLAQSPIKTSKTAKKPLKSKKTPRQKAMDKADMYFSRYIRLKYSFPASDTLACKCYTCGAVKSIKMIELGHWQRRGYKTVRFDENNGRPQCKRCNYFHSGMPERFELNLIKEVGQDEVDRLKRLAQEIGEDSEHFYREQAEEYKAKFKELLKARNIKNPWTK